MKTYPLEKIQEQLQLALILRKVNTIIGLLQLVKTRAPPLWSMPVKRTEPLKIFISSNDDSEANARSGYVKKEHKQELPSQFRLGKITKIFTKRM